MEPGVADVGVARLSGIFHSTSFAAILRLYVAAVYEDLNRLKGLIITKSSTCTKISTLKKRPLEIRSSTKHY